MRKPAKIFLWTVAGLFILLNFIAAMHAYKFTHYYDPVAGDTSSAQPGMSLQNIFMGFHFFRKPDNKFPDTTYETVYLSDNGIKLQGWMIKVPDAKGTIAMFHGHGGNKSDMLNEAKAFRNMGYNTFLLDFRAHGNSEGHTCTIGYKEADDVHLAYNYIKNSGEHHIYLWGISLGAASISRAISVYHFQPEKIILELPFGTLLQAVEARVRMMHLPAEPTAGLLTFWGGLENGYWAFNNSPVQYVKDIYCPVLLQFAGQDNRVTKSEETDIYNNISSPKKMVIYDSAGHESLFKNDSSKWVHEVYSFLNQ